jgi:glycosyltransferase involved in cell wall biosynthesis
VLPLCLFGGCRGELRGLGGRAVYFLNTFRQRAAVRAVRRHAGRIVSPSRALAERVRTATGRDVAVINYPIPAAADAEFAPPASDRLLFFGRLSREKGLRELYRALARPDVAAAGVRLSVAGAGPEEGPLADLATSLGIADRVRTLGWVDSARIPDLLREHGAVVVPSLWMENSPVSIAEALTAGRPVLAARRGGMPELVAEGKTGFLFEPTDPDSVAAALLRFANLAPGEREAMAGAARESARRLFDPARFLERIAAVYADALGASSSAPPPT